MYTNYIEIHVFKEQILNDFDLFFIELEKEEVDLSYSLLTDALKSCLSLYYRYYQGCFLLFKKNTMKQKQLVEDISKAIHVDCQYIKVLQLTKDSFNIKDHELCQLFMNNMVDHLKFGWQYLSGQLLLFNDNVLPKHKDGPITAYKLTASEVDKKAHHYILNIQVQSYYKLKKNLMYAKSKKEVNALYKKPIYVFDDKSCRLKRVLKVNKKDEEHYYVRKSPYHTKNKHTAKALEFLNVDEFYNCKQGLIYDFIHSFNDTCGKYVWIGLQKFDYHVLKVKKRPQLLDEKLVIEIKDGVKDELSHDYIKRIKQYADEYGISIQPKAKKKLYLIHDAKYYKQAKLKDLHQASLDIQHIIVDPRDKLDKNTFIKCLHELLVKEDLKNKILSLYNWELFDDFKYTLRYFINKDNYMFYCLKVDFFKNISFEQYEKGSAGFDYYDAFYREHNKRYGYLAPFEAIMEYQDQVYVLSKTGAFIIPNLDELLMRIDQNMGLMSREYLVQCLNEASCVLNNPFYEDLALVLDKDEYAFEEIVSNKNKQALMSLQKNKEGALFNQFMVEKKGIVLNPTLKSTVLKDFQHIHYLEKENEWYYYVGGRKTVNRDIPKNFLIRRISCVKGKLDKEFMLSILKMLSVDFVRNKEDSVYPFLHKYLNEYIRFIRKVNDDEIN